VAAQQQCRAVGAYVIPGGAASVCQHEPVDVIETEHRDFSGTQPQEQERQDDRAVPPP